MSAGDRLTCHARHAKRCAGSSRAFDVERPGWRSPRSLRPRERPSRVLTPPAHALLIAALRRRRVAVVGVATRRRGPAISSSRALILLADVTLFAATSPPARGRDRFRWRRLGGSPPDPRLVAAYAVGQDPGAVLAGADDLADAGRADARHGLRLAAGGRHGAGLLAAGAAGLPVLAGTLERGIGLACMMGPDRRLRSSASCWRPARGLLAERGWPTARSSQVRSRCCIAPR